MGLGSDFVTELTLPTTHRSWSVAGVVVLVLALVATVGAFVVAPARTRVNGRAAAATVTLGSPLTNTALGGVSQLDQIDMVSGSLGYALATRPLGADHFRYYLVRTTDQARSWRIVSALPSTIDFYPIFSDFSGVGNDQSIDFASRRVGYVSVAGSPLYETLDAGRSWTRLVVAGTASGYAMSGRTLSVVSTRCPRATTVLPRPCSSALELFRVGSAVPDAVRTIPVRRSRFHQGATLLAAVSATIDVVSQSNGGTTIGTSLLATHDGGQRWSTLVNPCSGLFIGQLIVNSRGWLLTCFHDYGMYHFTAKMFRSSSDGASWSTVLDDTPMRNVVGNLGGTEVYVIPGGNGRLLYGVLLNPAGGLVESTDGGTTWSSVDAVGYSGGSPGWISDVGPTAAIYQVFQGAVFVTADGINFHVLPALAAGPYRGVDICTARTTSVHLRHATLGGVASTSLRFTNHGTGPCYLDGAPLIQPTALGRAVGPAGTTTLLTSTGNFVVLAPGEAADVPLYVNSIPPAAVPCAAQRATSLEVAFGSPSQFVVPLGRPIDVCTRSLSVTVSYVRASRAST